MATLRDIRGSGAGLTLAALPLLLTGACAGDTEPALIPPGRYHYRASHPIPDSGDSIRLEGVLQVTFSEGDSLGGRWDVQRMHPEMRASTSEDGAVEIRGQPTYFGSIVHRITPQQGGRFACSGRYSWVAEGGERSLPVTCSLSAQVPAGLATPAPGATTIHPIDPDSVAG